MTYQSIVEMAGSDSLQARVAAAAAAEGFPDDPESFARNNIWGIVSSAGWADAWDYARAAGNAGNFNPDTGARSDVIDDAMILSVVQPMVQPELPA